MIVKRYNVKKAGEYRNRISLVDKHSIPISPYTVIFLNKWISQESASKKRKAEELKFILRELESIRPETANGTSGISGIDLVARALKGEFLSRSECRQLTDACKYKVKRSVDNIIPIESLNSLALRNAIHSANISNETVSNDTRKGRLKTAISFIEFLYEELHGQFRTPEHVKINYLASKHELELSLKEKTNEVENPSFEESKIPAPIYLRLLEIIQLESEENPFKQSKHRNSLIVQLILETGERRGAISKLKISDCKFEGSGDEIRITRTPDDPTDRRRDKPAQKTLQHSAYVDPEIMKSLDEYIKNERSKHAKSESHEFVFIAEHDSKGTAGEPLNTKGINQVFKTLSKALGFHLNPHLGRHKWNELFSDLTKNMSHEEADKLRRYAMGWSRTSEMVDVYNKFKHSVEVREIQRSRQQEIVSAGTSDE